jgi:hypothetical protein
VLAIGHNVTVVLTVRNKMRGVAAVETPIPSSISWGSRTLPAFLLSYIDHFLEDPLSKVFDATSGG